KVPATRSNTSVCLKVVDPAITALSLDAQSDFAKKLAGAVEKAEAGFDIGAYRDAPPGLRIWCGATIEAADVAALTQWLDWACALKKPRLPKAACRRLPFPPPRHCEERSDEAILDSAAPTFRRPVDL